MLFDFLILLGFMSTVLSSMTLQELKAACPNDRQICIGKAMKGDCFGSSLKATVLKKECKCSCDAVHHDRIQKCCKTVGEQEMKFCLPLCRYNTSNEELGSTLGLKCLSQLTTWAYCASDATDQTACCKKRGVVKECLSFCKGDVPTCDSQAILDYQPCTQHMQAIMQCQKEGLGAKPRYDPDWSSVCEWEGK
ncbi:DB module [Trichostrongylus colubriformis]|uniref:DB module n=1 Tax=Trichostrongylus colubriformis TaxID=6319 RepID=A0AAN8F9Q1_TRICO